MRSSITCTVSALVAVALNASLSSAYAFGIGVESFTYFQYTSAGPVQTQGQIGTCLIDPTGSCGSCGSNNQVGTAYNDDFTSPSVYGNTDCPNGKCVNFDSQGRTADDIKNAPTNSLVGILTDYTANVQMNCIAANSNLCDAAGPDPFGSNILNTVYAACDPGF